MSDAIPKPLRLRVGGEDRPLDIVAAADETFLATVYNPSARENYDPVWIAAEIVKRWNAHPHLLAALETQAERIEAAFSHYNAKGMIVDALYFGDVARCLRAAIAKELDQ